MISLQSAPGGTRTSTSPPVLVEEYDSVGSSFEIATGFGNGEQASLDFLWFGVLKLAEGVGNAPTSVGTDPVFKTGAASLYLPALPNW